MIDYRIFHQALSATPIEPWADQLLELAEIALHDRRHGKMSEWLSWLDELPDIVAAELSLNSDTVNIGLPSVLGVDICVGLESSLRKFHPWRKGPFAVFGVDIDTEWRSDWKWSRIKNHIQPLQHRNVLDVGCGSGYHLFRMLGEGASLAVGIDPTMLYVMQFYALKHFIHDANVHVLPLRIEQLPTSMQSFDTAFSMGVLYHCRSPIDHLTELKGALRSGGELVLETLVVNGGKEQVLVPAGRYAKMRNVWFIPSTAALTVWLQRAGFEDVRVVDVTKTSLDEQRKTSWMEFESLADFLDANDRSRTIEGYPAPIRATLCAIAP